MSALPNAILVATGLLLGSAGCANVLGIEDLTKLPDGGDIAESPGPSPGADADATTGSDVANDGTTSDASDAKSGGDAPVDALGDGSGATDGSDAGPDSAMCVAGGLCSPSECQVGQYACDGGPTCASVQSATNGTPCGTGDGGDSGTTGSVCNQGVCSLCDSGGDCSVANSCKKSVYVCSTGAAVCTMNGNALDGTGCGSGLYCYSGVCSACTVNNPCTPTNACHTGTVTSCTGGVATCTDTGQPATNGTSCGNNQVCNGGMCSSCAANVACTPTNDCHTGLTSCASGTSVCTDTGSSLTNGTLCTSTDKCNATYTCQSGMCQGSNPVTCTAMDQCHGVGTCDPTTGVCSQPALTNGTTCTGSNACLQTYTCQSGMCSGSNPVTCSVSGQTCQNGSCSCPSGPPAGCNGTCVNLTSDTNNCGRCSHPCLGGACTGGMCQAFTFTSAGGSIVDFATDGNVVVWTDSGDQSVDEVAVAGGAKIVLASSGQGVSGPTNIAIDPPSGTVFFLNGSGSQIGCSARVANGGTPGTPSFMSLGVGTIISASAHALVPIGAGGAAFLSQAMVYQTSCGATVAPIGGTSSALAGTTLARTPNGGYVFDDSSASQIVILNSSGTASTIANQLGNYVAQDGTFAYWATTSSIERAMLTSTTPSTVITNTNANATGLATDGTNVYFSAQNEVVYAPVGQTSNTGTVLTNTNGAYLKYASGALFLANGGTIYKIATP